MRARYHVVASAGVSLGFQAMSHSWPASLGCFLSGVLIDTDHYLEYCVTQKKFPFQYKDLVEFCCYNKEGKLYLVFHAYEYLFIFWGLIYLFDLGVIWLGIAIGLTTHIMFDQFTNPTKPLFYFLTYRFKNHFEKNKLLTEKYFQQAHEEAR